MLNNKKNKKNKKAFTIVELVIVIAVIAILAAVLIPTFASIIKKANDSAYLQERTNQTIIDSAEEIENPDYLSWKDFEALLAKKIVAARSAEYESLKTAVASAVTELRGKETALTDKQLAAIIERTLKGELTTAMVEPIIEVVVPFEAGAASLSLAENAGIVTLSENDRKDIVDKVIAKLGKEIGITADEMAAAIKAVRNDADPTAALTGFKNTLTAQQIQEIIEFALGQPAGDSTEDTENSETTGAVTGVSLSATETKRYIGEEQKLIATVHPENATNKNVTWTSSDNAVVTVDENGSLTAVAVGTATITVTTEEGGYTATCKVTVICNHRDMIVVGIITGGVTDSEKHQPVCNTCHEKQGDPEPHAFVDGVCKCGYEKTYTWVCSKNAEHSKDGTLSEIKKYAEYEKCENNHNLNHFDCPIGDGQSDSLVDCTGCLAIDRSDCDEHSKTFENTESSLGHRVTCADCNEAWTEEHKMANGTCSDCGYHKHNKSSFNDLGNGYHSSICSYSNCKQTFEEPHSCNRSDVTDYSKDGHTGKCKDCGATFTVAHTQDVNCAVCGYEWCKHTTIKYVDLGNGTHQQQCANSECHVKTFGEPVAHNMVNNICEQCKYSPNCTHDGVANGQTCACETMVYILSTSNDVSNKLTSYLSTAASHKSVYIRLEYNNGLNTSGLTIPKNAKVTIDLNGKTIKLSNKNITVSSGAQLKIIGGSNGTITGLTYISVSSDAQLTLDGINLGNSSTKLTGQNVINANSNATININNSNIYNSNANVRVVYFNSETHNASVTISDSNFILNASKPYFVYYNNINSSGNIIAISGTTKVGETTIGSDNVINYIYDNGTNPSITPTPAA